MHQPTPSTPERLREIARELTAIANALEPEAAAAPTSAPEHLPPHEKTEPQWIPEWRRSWRFLKVFEDAGGSLAPKEVSLAALRVGYPSPAATNGYYRGDGGCLRKNGDRRELTDAGYRFLREWDSHFGPGSLYENGS